MLNRLAAFLSTMTGLPPYRWRMGLKDARRSLEAAGGGRRWTEAATATSSGVIHQGAATVAARAAHFALNNPHGAKIVEALSANLVGSGIKPRSQHPSEAIRTRLHMAFALWCDSADADGRCDFYGLQQLLVRDLVVFGEGLFIFAVEPSSGAPQLRRLHPEQLDRSWTRRTDEGGAIHQGVEFGPDGRIRAYHLRRSAPGDALAGYPVGPDRVPASEVLHVFRPLFPGQVRGLSWFAPILLAARELDALADAMLVRAKIAAMHAGVIHDAEGAAAYDGQQSGANLEVALEPGSMPVLPPGKAIDWFPLPDQGGANTLMVETLRQIAVGAGITFEQLTGNYEHVNYSSERSAKLEFRRFAEGIQHHVLVHQFCRPIWRRFIRHQVLAGLVPATAFLAERASFEVVKWLPPAWPWVDPANEANAAEVELRNRLRSRSEIIAERGYDSEDVDREIAADAARLARLGIVDTPPAPAGAERQAGLAHVLFRASFRPASIDEENRTAELVASTGAGVTRVDLEGPFLEVLDVRPSSIDLSRGEGMPLLDSHRQDGLDRVLGVVRGFRFEAGSLIATVEFSARAEGFWQDVKAGIIRNVSVGYLPIEWRDEVDAKGARIRRVTRWQIREVSLVPVGADPAATVRTA
jgi:lambda family phage portal protein